MDPRQWTHGNGPTCASSRNRLSATRQADANLLTLLVCKTIANDRPHRRDSVTPADLLSIREIAAAITNRHLPNAQVAPRDLSRQLWLNSEAATTDGNAVKRVAPETLIARFHIRQIETRRQVTHERQSTVAEIVQKTIAVTGRILLVNQVARTLNNVGIATNHRC